MEAVHGHPKLRTVSAHNKKNKMLSNLSKFYIGVVYSSTREGMIV